ncbi:hypothetical protein EVAR_9515_1 [Eumeta japonica]|uniref:Uncharacterized protein n=1 Tax=Eumeta variegata TaxID=151549 RepID=A0A4C1U3I1_EUMVA|nr:hypothetical protein EVAR_9515_1 [Eumeta japonica]
MRVNFDPLGAEPSTQLIDGTLKVESPPTTLGNSLREACVNMEYFGSFIYVHWNVSWNGGRVVGVLPSKLKDLAGLGSRQGQTDRRTFDSSQIKSLPSCLGEHV